MSLMEAVGQRLADLTRAEWGIVTAGCAAALTHATSACIAGGDPEKMQRMPNLTGLKSEVVVPRYSRNEYDHAVRMLGVKMVEVETAAEFEAAIGPQTAMVMILSCPAAENGRDLHPECLLHRAPQRRPGDRGCGGRDAHDSQYPFAAWREHGGVQRR